MIVLVLALAGGMAVGAAHPQGVKQAPGKVYHGIGHAIHWLVKN